jgi:lipid A 3-O-deacylase
MYLEGDSPTYDVNLDKETYVYDAQTGLAVIWRRFRFAYNYVIRSKEYEGQEEADRFGSVGMTFRF